MTFVFYAGLLGLCFIIQSTMFNFITLNVYPDLIIALAVYGGLKWGRMGGVMFGGLVGFSQDLLSYGSLGLNLLSKSLIGFSVGLLNDRFIDDSVFTRALFAAAATVFDFALNAALTRALYGFEGADFGLAALQSVINIPAALLLIPAISAMEASFMAKTGRKPGWDYMDRGGRGIRL